MAPTSCAGTRWRGTIDAGGLEGVDAVVHLAGESIAGGRWNVAKKVMIRESRVRGTTLLAETLAKLDRPPAVFVSGSAIGYYGDRGDQLLTEASTPADDFLAQVCVDWEAAATAAATAGVRVVNIRTGIVLDRREGALAKMLPLFRFGVGGRLGNGRQYWSWITLEDMVGAVRYLVDQPVSGAVNLTAPKPVTNREFTRTLAKVLGRPALFPVPAFGPEAAPRRRVGRGAAVHQRPGATRGVDRCRLYLPPPHARGRPAVGSGQVGATPMAKERKVSVSRVIAASPEAIFAVIDDPSLHPVIDGSGTVTERQARPSTHLKLGDKFGMNMRIGVPYRIAQHGGGVPKRTG